MKIIDLQTDNVRYFLMFCVHKKRGRKFGKREKDDSCTKHISD